MPTLAFHAAMPRLRNAALAGLSALALAAQAQSLSLTGPPGPLQVGDSFEVRLAMDFTGQPTLGGGVDLAFDPLVLQFTGFSFGPALGDDPSFRRQPDLQGGRLVGLAFGHFNGLAGPAEVGRFGFTAVSAAATTLNLAPNVAPAGDFISLQTFGPQQVQFGSLGLAVSAVPEPGSAALALLGLAGLGGLAARRRRGATPACS